MGDKGGKKDKEKNKQQQLTKQKQGERKEHDKAPAKKPWQEQRKADSCARRTGLTSRFAAQGSATAEHDRIRRIFRAPRTFRHLAEPLAPLACKEFPENRSLPQPQSRIF